MIPSWIINFNSIKVRLERIFNLPLADSYKNFNSIKVRLELLPIDDDKYIKLFQFHKGTIRTNEVEFLDGSIRIFQFHKGTIRTTQSAPGIAAPSPFQFHKGTIRTSNQITTINNRQISIP